jgi:hypothetical protein
MASQSSVITGALGAVLGYIGSEVAEVVVFERLLWPQRYYNDFTFSTALRDALFMTTGGPLHAAALQTLDVLGGHGLYRGAGRGNMLGTVFYPDSNTTYSTAAFGKDGIEKAVGDGQARNGFWIEVMRHVDKKKTSEDPNDIMEKMDVENPDSRRVRAVQAVHCLRLWSIADKDAQAAQSSVIMVREDCVTWKTFAGIFISETVAIGAGVGSIFLGSFWMTIFMFIPLLLKVFAVPLSLRREGLQDLEREKNTGSKSDVLVTVQGAQQGFLLIEGPAPVIAQFFRHYGHPIRTGKSWWSTNRLRETMSIVLVYCFVLYFPAGLIITTFQDDSMQYLWLSYQLYSVLGMHIVRLFDLQGYGRTEQRIARYLCCENRPFWLYSQGGGRVAAKVETTFVAGYAEGTRMVEDRIKDFQAKSDSEQSK